MSQILLQRILFNTFKELFKAFNHTTYETPSAIERERVIVASNIFFQFSVCEYCKVANSSMFCLVALCRFFRLFRKEKFDVYVLFFWPFLIGCMVTNSWDTCLLVQLWLQRIPTLRGFWDLKKVCFAKFVLLGLPQSLQEEGLGRYNSYHEWRSHKW